MNFCPDRQPLLKTLINLQILSYECRNLNYPKMIMLAYTYTKLTLKNIICVKCINCFIMVKLYFYQNEAMCLINHFNSFKCLIEYIVYVNKGLYYRLFLKMIFRICIYHYYRKKWEPLT